MTGGNSPIGYLKAFHTNLYLSADPDKVEKALEEGGPTGRSHGAGSEAASMSDSVLMFRYCCSHHVHPEKDGGSVGDSAAGCL